MELTLHCRNGIAAIHEELRSTLQFPHWYGNNLDALHDCLSEIAFDLTITLTEPELLPALGRVLADAAEENPHLTVIA